MFDYPCGRPCSLGLSELVSGSIHPPPPVTVAPAAYPVDASIHPLPSEWSEQQQISRPLPTIAQRDQQATPHRNSGTDVGSGCCCCGLLVVRLGTAAAVAAMADALEWRAELRLAARSSIQLICYRMRLPAFRCWPAVAHASSEA